MTSPDLRSAGGDSGEATRDRDREALDASVPGEVVSAGQEPIPEIFAAFFSGPLPPPEILRAYNRIVPGSAKQIIDNVIEQSTHRRQLEAKVIAADIERSRLGLIVGGVVALACIAGGCVVAAISSPTAGGTIATASVIGLTSVFVYGTVSRRREREHKARISEQMTRRQAEPPSVGGPSARPSP